MAVGLLLGFNELICISVLLLIIGAPLWPIEIIRTGIMELTSIGTHYAGLIVGLFVLRKAGMGRNSWLYAWILFLVLQQFTRLFTPAELNINLAHSIYPGWENIFSAYWQYWLFTSLGSILCLWLTSKALSWSFGKWNKLSGKFS